MHAKFQAAKFHGFGVMVEIQTYIHTLTLIIIDADDTAIVGCLSDQSYFDEIDILNKWFGDFFLTLNVCKTKEIILDFRKGHNHEPATIHPSGPYSVQSVGAA